MIGFRRHPSQEVKRCLSPDITKRKHKEKEQNPFHNFFKMSQNRLTRLINTGLCLSAIFLGLPKFAISEVVVRTRSIKINK